MDSLVILQSVVENGHRSPGGDFKESAGGSCYEGGSVVSFGSFRIFPSLIALLLTGSMPDQVTD